jgi:predicted amidohydrolase
MGADVIVCPANPVTESWQLVLPARAIENNVYLALANRSGSQTRSRIQLTFRGKSAIYEFDGHELMTAGPKGDAVLLCEIHPQKTRDKSFNPLNNVLSDRRPGHYRELVGANRNRQRPVVKNKH